MTAPQLTSTYNQNADSGSLVAFAGQPVVPVVPTSMLAYLAWRQHQHRLDQEVVASDLVRQMIGLWSLQDFENLNTSTPTWLATTAPRVQAAYLQSQRLQAIYSHDVRMASLPNEAVAAMKIPEVGLPDNVIPGFFDKSLIPDVAADPASQALITFDDFPLADAIMSLTITGNYNLKAQMPGPADELMQNARTNSAGAGVRHAMNGGRNAVNNIVKMDRRVIGYARVTDSDPCYFCALLASRGADYGKTSFVGANKKFTANKNARTDLPASWTPARTHDHCRCFLRPVYAKSQSYDDEAKFYLDQWEKTTKKWYGFTNKEQIEKFRETYRPFDRPEPEIHDVREELQSRVSALADAGHTRTTPQSMWAYRQLDQLA